VRQGYRRVRAARSAVTVDLARDDAEQRAAVGGGEQRDIVA
jgi:hypothetical protein